MKEYTSHKEHSVSSLYPNANTHHSPQQGYPRGNAIVCVLSQRKRPRSSLLQRKTHHGGHLPRQQAHCFPVPKPCFPSLHWPRKQWAISEDMSITQGRCRCFMDTSYMTSPYSVYYPPDLQLIHCSSPDHPSTFISSSIRALPVFEISILNHFTLKYFNLSSTSFKVSLQNQSKITIKLPRFPQCFTDSWWCFTLIVLYPFYLFAEDFAIPRITDWFGRFIGRETFH